MKLGKELLFLVALLGLTCENVRGQEMWIANITHGISSFHPNPSDYRVYRNVMEFGCRGDGVTDDTACFNTAISSGGRCGLNCGSSTILPALVYVPSGRYLISSPIVMYYYTQLVGNALNPPVLVAAPTFQGMAVLESNPYDDGGNNWFTNQNNFFRQVRNFVVDLTQTPPAAATTGLHWQVAQATSLINLKFIMSRDANTNHQGIWMENGSGGFMSNLTFEGGRFGMWVGNQQFLSTDMTFNYCRTAIYMNWNWQWTFKGITFNNVGVGIDMTALNGGAVYNGVGSILLMDSTLKDTATGVLVNTNTAPGPNDVSGTLLLDNVLVENSPAVVANAQGQRVLEVQGTATVASWGRGSRYTDQSGSGTYTAGYLPTPQKSPSLLDSQGRFLERPRPQYEHLSVNDFASVKDGGARGDGVTDDADAIQAVINANVNSKVVFFPAGSYVIGRTVHIPPGTRMTGETWTVLMAGGSAFQNQNSPQPMLQIGMPGQSGSVEISDFMFSSKGAQPGAILIQWNLRESSPGSAAMWDAHFRVGGFQGTNLQVPQCPRGQGYVPQCVGVHTLLHLTTQSSALLSNVWAWTADHDLDNHLAQGQISIYTGRGVLVESNPGPVWLYGTQSEHNVMYQYQLTNARNVFMTMIQSETPYWQPGPAAPTPFTPNAVFSDPTYGHCQAGDVKCPLSWSIRATGCSNVYVYGAGMYNFFSNYDQTCLLTEDCQSGMVSLDNNSAFYVYNGNTKAAVNMFLRDNLTPLARAVDNVNGFCRTINAFLPFV